MSSDRFMLSQCKLHSTWASLVFMQSVNQPHPLRRTRPHQTRTSIQDERGRAWAPNPYCPAPEVFPSFDLYLCQNVACLGTVVGVQETAPPPHFKDMAFLPPLSLHNSLLLSLLSSPSPSFSSRGSPLRRRRCVQFRPGFVRAWHVPRASDTLGGFTLAPFKGVLFFRQRSRQPFGMARYLDSIWSIYHHLGHFVLLSDNYGNLCNSLVDCPRS